MSAAAIACGQAIAADGCFALAMLADLRDLPGAPWLYRRLFWETGAIGQTLYLEAEALGIAATGIGCCVARAGSPRTLRTPRRRRDQEGHREEDRRQEGRRQEGQPRQLKGRGRHRPRASFVDLPRWHALAVKRP